MLRFAYLCMYGGCAALGVSASARPALLWVRGFGLFGSIVSSPVPFGWAFAVLAVAIAGCVIALSGDVAMERRSSHGRHATLLVLVAVAAALRSSVEPLPRVEPREQTPESVGRPPTRREDATFPAYSSPRPGFDWR